MDADYSNHIETLDDCEILRMWCPAATVGMLLSARIKQFTLQLVCTTFKKCFLSTHQHLFQNLI